MEDENAEELDSTRGYGTNGLESNGTIMYCGRGMSDSRTTINSSGQMQRTASVQSSLYRQALGGRPSRSNSLAESFVSDDSYRGGAKSGKRDGFEDDTGLAGSESLRFALYTSWLSVLFFSIVPDKSLAIEIQAQTVLRCRCPGSEHPSSAHCKQGNSSSCFPAVRLHARPDIIRERWLNTRWHLACSRMQIDEPYVGRQAVQ